MFREGTENPRVTDKKLQRTTVEIGGVLQRVFYQAFRIVANQKPLLSKRYLTARNCKASQDPGRNEQSKNTNRSLKKTPL